MNILIDFQHIENEITSFLKHEILDPSVIITPNDKLSVVGLQSLDLMELVFFIERKYQCKLPAELLREEVLFSINSIALFVSDFLVSDLSPSHIQAELNNEN